MDDLSEWMDVATLADFPPGSCRTVDAGGTSIAVFNIDSAFYAIEDRCTHEAEMLSHGKVEGLEITCPRHQARFSLRSGEALCPPAYEPVATFPVRIANGMVQVRDNRLDD